MHSDLKPLKLSYELPWRTKADDLFLQSPEWKAKKLKILERGDSSCDYCGEKSERGQHVNHIDGSPKNNVDSNLEVICPECHMFLHSRLWCVVRKVVICFRESKYSQNDIVILTRKMRAEGRPDSEIIAFLGLEQQVPWIQNLHYLSNLFGFISSRVSTISGPKPYLTERQQKKSIASMKDW